MVAVKDRRTGKAAVQVVEGTDRATLTGFVADHTVDETTMVFTDEHKAYKGIINHVAVAHSREEYVRGEVHTNGIESHFSMFKRGIIGTVPSHQPEAHREIRSRVRGPPQQPASGHGGADGADGRGHGRQAASLR